MDQQENLLASSSGKKRAEAKMQQSSSPDSHAAPEPPTKKLRRSYVACVSTHPQPEPEPEPTAADTGPAQLPQVPLAQDQVLRRDAVPQLQEEQQLEPVRLPGPRSEGRDF